VAGGCGIVGSGIVKSLVEQGAKCCVSSRNEKSFDELKALVPGQFHSQLSFYKADLNKEENVLRLKEDILKREGALNHVIASIGGWRTDGNLSTLNLDQYKKAVDDMTVPHFNCYKAFVPHLSAQAKSTYTFITGGSGEAKAFDPKASILPIAASHVYGMYTSAVSEHQRNKNLALIQLRLFFWIRKELDSKFDAKKSELEVGHDFVGKFVPKLIVKQKSEIYKIQTRSIGNALYEKL
jgi:NAD(P)-dependent dehydrogenase (short-subunit alcohol dehydrogenase family)